MFGDNKSVVTSLTIPHSRLGKRWNALSYHRVREAVAGGWLRFEHIPGTENPADLLTKALPWTVSWKYLEPLLLWKGDTADAPSGSANPEGSIKCPSCGTTTDELAGSAGKPMSNLCIDPMALSTDEQAEPVFNALWNNQYCVFAEEAD